MKKHITNPQEIQIKEILESKGIDYVHESQNNGSRLDFYIPKYNVYIEVKQYYSERSNSQLSSQDNVILIQGKDAISFFKLLI